MTHVEAQKLVTVLAAGYASALARLPERAQAEWQDVFRNMLLDLDYAAGNFAVKTLLATQKFLPGVSEARELALNPLGKITTGGDAWGRVMLAVRGEGVHRVPGKNFTFGDPIIMRCVLAFGWAEICSSENMIADRARFIDMYEQFADQRRVNMLTDGLPDVRAYRELVAAREREEALPDARTGEAMSMGKLLQFVASTAEHDATEGE